ncbi:HAD-IIB family hydrolase [Sansalvadorimonas verongulae]|uniref:HAD-IIB family hydrolase n=1 Tax=Sansalvadorimonas verongulae TaxID=2172824 RepID=UPI0012BD28B1|nr:HAD-IIB family hydrolase [Sansalvadorimonas verongulae]MTI15301.1 HAD-IIB family hydrolase [Sansalvadorimonas verongulae]
MKDIRLLVFTDLDGTLLDHESYSTEPAAEALALLKALHIPLIFNTSKTRTETVFLRNQLNNNDPFATENGSCLSIPDNYFSGEAEKGYRTTMFGSLYSQTIQILANIRSEYGLSFTGFHDMTLREISACTGLDLEEAKRARDRDCSEPLIWSDTEENLSLFKRLLDARNLHLTRGGRFHYVSSEGNKGLIVQWLKDHFQAEYPDSKFMTIGLGDGSNDLPMLEAVDNPVLVISDHGHAPKCNHIKNLITTDAPGPVGWNQTILKLVHELLYES